MLSEFPLRAPNGWQFMGKVNGKLAWRDFSGLAVLYSLDEVELGKREHHVSISYRRGGPAKRYVDTVIAQWNLNGWDRDDQGSPLAHFWKKEKSDG